MKKHYFFLLRVIIATMLALGLISQSLAENIILENKSGVKIVIPKTAKGYAFGTVSLNGNPVEDSLQDGMILFKNIENNQDFWFYASEEKKISSLKWQFSGEGNIDGTMITFSLLIELPENKKAVNLAYDFKVDKDLQNLQACLLFNSDFAYDWKCHMYPWAADARFIQRDPLSWMGIPSLILYRDDMSMGMMWGIDPDSDYLNPTTWTKDFGLYFINGQIPAQYRVGGESLKKEVNYHCPMQLILTDKKDPDFLITDLVQSWMNHNHYQVEKLYVRSTDEALNLFMHGRRNTSMWYPGKGYRLD